MLAGCAAALVAVAWAYLGEKPARVATAQAPVRHAADGVDPVTAACVKDALLIETSPVMLGGSQIGMVELINSVRCAASWARIYLPPGQPDMLGEVTVWASDGRLATFANLLIEQVPVNTDVITPGGSGCLAAEDEFRLAGRALATASIPCWKPVA